MTGDNESRGSGVLHLEDAYLFECDARVQRTVGEDGVVLDRTVFFGGGGGQPCDVGWLDPAEAESVEVAAAAVTPGGDLLHSVRGGLASLSVGVSVRVRIDRERRFRHMRMHTAMHLLSVALPYPVTGGAVGAEKSRLDFDMQEAPDRHCIEERLHRWIEADLPVSATWISEEELRQRPELVKTVGARPPVGSGLVRLVGIGAEGDIVDLQPCGGTHVRSTAEIGGIRIGKIEKKGRRNRRVNLHLAE